MLSIVPRTVLISIFDLLSSSIEHLLVTDHRTHITILRDFDVHSRDWLLRSSDTSGMGREPEQFAVVSNLPQLMYILARIFDRTGDGAHTLDLLFASVLFLYSDISVFTPIG